MKVWKIEHSEKSNEGTKIAISLSSHESIGVILQPGEFILSQDQNTASLDSQKRRGFVNVEEFDNSNFRFDLGRTYSKSVLKVEAPVEVIEEPTVLPVDKLSEAEKDATDYMNTDI